MHRGPGQFPVQMVPADPAGADLPCWCRSALLSAASCACEPRLVSSQDVMMPPDGRQLHLQAPCAI